MVHGEQSAEGRRDERGVECADQRQVPTGGVGEARDGSGRVLNRLIAWSEDRTGLSRALFAGSNQHSLCQGWLRFWDS